jgi:spoIIIJ-associated protein
MNDLSPREKIALEAKALLQRMGFDVEVSVSEKLLSDERVEYVCELVVREGQQLLIGQHGANLQALLHLLRVLTRKFLPERSILSLDVNHYFAEKKNFLEQEALRAVKEVVETGLPLSLRPMIAYERKLIHTLLADHPDVVTESVGSGEDRKVLIRRKSGEDSLSEE